GALLLARASCSPRPSPGRVPARGAASDARAEAAPRPARGAAAVLAADVIAPVPRSAAERATIAAARAACPGKRRDPSIRSSQRRTGDPLRRYGPGRAVSVGGWWKVCRENPESARRPAKRAAGGIGAAFGLDFPCPAGRVADRPRRSTTRSAGAMEGWQNG